MWNNLSYKTINSSSNLHHKAGDGIVRKQDDRPDGNQKRNDHVY
jgi:hypothetical protein